VSPKASSDAPEAVDSASGAAARAKRPKVADVVAEGLYIAVATTRLSLKNRILMDTIAGGEGYDVDRFLPDARAALLSLADEADEAADRVRREARDAWRRFTDPDGTHDYGSRDVRNLRRRRRQSRKVAKELRARADDEDALRQIVVAARDAAWQELAANIDRTLRVEAARPDLEPDYARMRDARMQSLRLVDLAALSSQQRQRAKSRGAQAADDAPGEGD
jgi:hypothetical protein